MDQQIKHKIQEETSKERNAHVHAVVRALLKNTEHPYEIRMFLESMCELGFEGITVRRLMNSVTCLTPKPTAYTPDAENLEHGKTEGEQIKGLTGDDIVGLEREARETEIQIKNLRKAHPKLNKLALRILRAIPKEEFIHVSKLRDQFSATPKAKWRSAMEALRKSNLVLRRGRTNQTEYKRK